SQCPESQIPSLDGIGQQPQRHKDTKETRVNKPLFARFLCVFVSLWLPSNPPIFHQLHLYITGRYAGRTNPARKGTMMMTRRDAVAAFALFAEFLASARHTDAQTQ